MTAAYPWENPDAPWYVRERVAKMEIPGKPGTRGDLPRRRPGDSLPPVMEQASCGVVVMTHRGYSNGRLSVCLSSIPENYPVMVASDAIASQEAAADREVALHHRAGFSHLAPWAGRAANAIHAMACTSWTWTLFLCDDVWLFPETCSEMFRWGIALRAHGVPLASLNAPVRHTYHEHEQYGFESWSQCLADPYKFERLPPHPEFVRAPALFTNPFGAGMLIYRPAYDDVGGFSHDYWAHDDVFHHRVWTSGRWVNACYPGRGIMHLGAQSWHEGETPEWVGTFDKAIGFDGSEEDARNHSGALQAAAKIAWAEKLAPIFESLGGQGAV